MIFVDSHTHLFDTQFDQDRTAMMQRAIASGVEKMYLPNIDTETVAPMLAMKRQWPENCFPMLGLHPCSVKENFQEELTALYAWFEKEEFVAVGEIGLDFYWDKTFEKQQQEAFETQIGWALSKNLPIVIHTRNSLKEGIETIRKMQNGNLKGVFHCFSGSPEEAEQIIDMGFYIGIGGVATFKNGGLDPVLQSVGLEHILLETDAPYLAPVPYRGKRNESANIPLIAQKISDVKAIRIEDVATTTTQNTYKLFHPNK